MFDRKPTTKLTFLSLLLSLTAFVSTPAWAEADHQDENFPEGNLLALEGEDVITKQECFLFIMDTGYTGGEKRPDQFFAKVLTGYTHNDEHADLLNLRVSPDHPEMLVGTGSNGKDQVAVLLATPEDLTTATAFNAKWWHVNHYHNNRCVNLKVHAH